MLCFFSAKGGSGCSVSAAAAALEAARSGPTLLVDLAGDQPGILGIEASGEGLGAWYSAEAPPPDALSRLEVPVSPNLALLPLGVRRAVASPSQYRVLASLLADDRRTVVVDVGCDSIPAVALLGAATRSVLVTRACYLALRAAGYGPNADEILLVEEPGRALRKSDVSSALGLPVSVTVPWDPAVARAVDAGLLASKKLPRSLRKVQTLL